MTSYLNNLTEYTIKESTECIPDDVNSFKQINYEYRLEIPCDKVGIKAIEKVIASTDIKSAHLITTPSGVSVDGKFLTGYKVMTVGTIKLMVAYDSCDNNGVQLANYLIPFSVPVVAPKCYKDYPNFLANIKIEYVNAEIIDPRTIYVSLSMLVLVEV